MAHDEHDGRELPGPMQTAGIESPPKSILGTLSRLGPGMIIAGSIVGSGELILTTKTGAEAGFWLLWLIIIGCVIKVSTQIEFARHTITWGDTPLKALNAVPGPRLRVNWLLWYWTFMTILVVFQQGGILGGVGQTLAISQPLTAYGAEYNRMQDSLVKVRIDLKVLQAHTGESGKLDQASGEILIPGYQRSRQALILWGIFIALVVLFNGTIPFLLGVDLHAWTGSPIKSVLFAFVFYAVLFFAVPLILIKGR